jgi:hypothetical protein
MNVRTLILPAVLLAANAVSQSTRAASPSGNAESQAEAARRQLVADYVGLYQADTLDRWKELFHPGLTVTDPRPDGSIRVRGLEEFFAAQKAGFQAGRIDGEKLENVRVEAGRRIARVTADFVFSGEGTTSRGRLGLHVVQEGDRWKIVSIVYSYDS